MIPALLTAVVAVGLGAAIGLVRGGAERLAGPAQTFALVSVLTLVCARLIPDALSEIGPWALAVFALAFVAPGMLERAVARVRGDGAERASGLGLEIGYLGLAVHQVGDGLVLGAYSGGAHYGHLHPDVLLAVGAHTVPTAALMVLAYRRRVGTGAAIARAIGLALVTIAGIGVTAVAPLREFDNYEPWLSAAVGGLLTHVVAHGFHDEPLTTAPGRSWDLVAIALGVGTVLAAGGHADASHGAALPVGDAFLDLALETAPLVLLGLAVGAALQLFGSRIPPGWLTGGGSFGQAVRGAVIGAPLPVCACGVLPIAQGLRQRGAGTAFVVAFLLSTPELGVETFALTVRFLGWPFAWVRLCTAVGIAILAGLLVARTRGGTEVTQGAASARGEGAATAENPASASLPVAPDTDRVGARFVHYFDELLHHVGPWTVVGLLAAAYMQAGLDTDALAGMAASGWDVPIVMLVAVPSYVCASSATPFAAVLLAKGLSPGAVLAGLLLGPATNVATFGWLTRSFGGRAALAGIGGIIVACGGLAVLVNATGIEAAPASAAVVAHEHGPFAYAGVVVLGVLLMRGIWRTGLRAWLGSLGESLNAGRPHGHAHAHGHGRAGHAHAPPDDHDHAHGHARSGT
jgi:hypothetical protein